MSRLEWRRPFVADAAGREHRDVGEDGGRCRRCRARRRRTTRRVLGQGIGALRRAAASAGLRTGQAGAWVYAYRGPLRVAVVVLAAGALIIWNEPSITVIFTLTAVTLLALAVIEFLARPPGEEPAGAPSADPQTGTVVDADPLPPPTADEPALAQTHGRG
jgi:hypothetical protein